MSGDSHDDQFASDAEIQAEEDTHASWVHKVKLAFIIIKITVVSIFLISASYRYIKRYKQCSVISFILCCYVAMLLILLAMDVTIKVIPVFFVLIMLANYFNFVGFWYILRTLPCMEGRVLRRRTKFYFVSMNCLYVTLFGVAFIPGMRPLCTDEKAYPYVLTLAQALFLINYLFHLVVYNKKAYFIQDAAASSANTSVNEALINKDEGENADDEEGEEEQKLSWHHKQESQSLRKAMFRRQTRFYLCFSTILVLFNIAIQCWGRIAAHDHVVLGCAEKGYQWLYTTMFGEMFITAHIVQIIMQAVMLEKALYQVPHELGWFEAPSHVEQSDSEDEKDDGIIDHEAKGVDGEKDDGYKAIN